MLSLQVMNTSTAQVRLISSEKMISFYMTQSCQWWPGSKFSGPGTMSPADALHCSVSWSCHDPDPSNQRSVRLEEIIFLIVTIQVTQVQVSPQSKVKFELKSL